MKAAIFSDVHGNAVALDAVLDDIRSLNPATIIFAGDLALGGSEPEACVTRVRSLGILSVRGNTDEFFADGQRVRGDPLVGWTHNRLSAASRAWLPALPFEHRVDDLLVVHATPWSISEVVPKGAGVETLRRMLEEGRAAAAIYGHTHVGWIGEVPGAGIVVNTGSVGAPFDGDPRASYAVLERGPSGWTARLCRVAYDVGRAVGTFPSDHPARGLWTSIVRTGRRS
ncbi:MAG: metallophosphoesterase family protein [bacterium]